MGFHTPSRDDGVRHRPARFASVVLEDLAQRITRGDFPPGSVLPTEPALCAEFGFSRTVVREALKLLEERGLVRVEQGRGTTVQSRESWNLLDPVVIQMALEADGDMSLLGSLINVRRVLEQESARAAAARLTAADFAKLGAIIDKMEASYDDYGVFQACDSDFHETILRAAGNEVSTNIIRAIHRHGGVVPTIAAPTSTDDLARTVREHREVVDALAAGDGDRAAALMSAHVANAWAVRSTRRAPA